MKSLNFRTVFKIIDCSYISLSWPGMKSAEKRRNKRDPLSQGEKKAHPYRGSNPEASNYRSDALMTELSGRQWHTACILDVWIPLTVHPLLVKKSYLMMKMTLLSVNGMGNGTEQNTIINIFCKAVFIYIHRIHPLILIPASYIVFDNWASCRNNIHTQL